MTIGDLRRQERLREFIGEMTEGMGRVERRRALGNYLCGLLLAGERKSVQALAQRLAHEPQEAEAYRQRMQQADLLSEIMHALRGLHKFNVDRSS